MSQNIEDPEVECFAQSKCDLDLDKFLEQAKSFNEPSLWDPLEECFAEFGCDLDLDKFLEQVEISNEPNLEDPMEECFAHFEYDLDLNMSKLRLYWIPLLRCEFRMGNPLRYPSLTSSVAEPLYIENNNLEEEEEQIELLSTPSLSNDKEVSTEAHSFITIPLKTRHEPQASFIQFLKEPSHAKILKDPCKQASKSRNHRPKKILTSNRIGYLRWQNILP